MRGKAIALILLAVLAMSSWMAINNSEQKSAAESPALITAPDFTWQSFDGTTHTLKELSGHVVILHFWASWCAPCRSEFPHMLAAAQRMGKDVIFLTVSSDDTLEKAQSFVQQAQDASGTNNLPNVLYAFDPQKKITYDMFQTVAYPETIVLDGAMHMRRKYPGPVAWENSDVQGYIKQLHF